MGVTLIVSSDEDKLSLECLGNRAEHCIDLGVGGEVSSLGPEDELLLDTRVEDLVRIALGELDSERELLSSDEGLDFLSVRQGTREGDGLTVLACEEGVTNYHF